MKTLILFYSYGGNTRKAAQILQRETGGDVAEIETVMPYTGSYNSVVDQGQREVNSGFMPEIKPLSVDISAYDRIFLGTPVWWYTFAPAVKTFLKNFGTSLAGKEIHPFITNGGWIGHTAKDIHKACPGAKVGKEINLRFDGNNLLVSEKEIKRWANEAEKGK